MPDITISIPAKHSLRVRDAVRAVSGDPSLDAAGTRTWIQAAFRAQLIRWVQEHEAANEYESKRDAVQSELGDIT